MSSRAVVLREVATIDVNAAIDWYRRAGSESLALRFVDALEAALVGIARDPAAGSPRYAEALDLPGLRARLVSGFPYAVFYVHSPSHVEVWRVLHCARDLPAILDEPE